MGIKDVWGRIKGKSDEDQGRAAADDALSRRQTNEETIQVKVGSQAPPAAQPAAANDGSQESATVVVKREAEPPATPPENEAREEATVVANAGPPPTPRNAGPTPRAPVAPPPVVRPSVTPVAPSSDRLAVPKPETPAPAPAPASKATSSRVSSGDDTLYQKPEADNSLDIAALLVGIFGEVKNEVFRLPFGAATIGRGDGCTVQLLDAKVSREHASVRCGDGTIEVTPLNDRNPILVNDEPIAGPRAVADGDKIQFGNAGASILRLRTVAGL